VGLLLLGYALFDHRVFLEGGLPLFFDAHSHFTRSWLAARALSAGGYPSWSFEWYGGYRLLEFYSPGYYLLTGALANLFGDLAAVTKLVLYAGQVLAVVAFYVFLLRLRLAPLAAAFGTLILIHDAERWRVLAVIGNYPSIFVYAITPLVLLAITRTAATPRANLRRFAAGTLLLAAMAFGHLTNAAQILPALLAFAVVWLLAEAAPPVPLRMLGALAASLLALAAFTACLSLPMLRDLPLVSLSLDAGIPGWDLEPVLIALGLRSGSMERIFVTTPGAVWCAVALAGGLLSLRRRASRFRACFAGWLTSLLSLAVLGERAALAPSFFVAALCAAALELTSRALRTRGAAAAVALEALALAAVPVWHLQRDLTPLRYIDRETLAVYRRIPEGGLERTFDVSLATDAVDGVYGRSSFSPFWTGRAIPFGAFPQGAPVASNLQLALTGKLVGELAADPPVLSGDALDLLFLLHVGWLVDRDEPPRLARLVLDPELTELREPGLLRLRHAAPALFATRVEVLPGRPAGPRQAEPAALIAKLLARWERDPFATRGARSLDALSRTGTRRDWPLLLPLLRRMRIDPARARADRFLVARAPTGPDPAPAVAEFSVLGHTEARLSVEVVARASAPGFVRLAYAFDPELRARIDGESAIAVPDFLGGVVLPFPAGTHTIALEAPPASLRLGLLWAGAGIAGALAMLWAFGRSAGAATPSRSESS
jgi:hypothetical protein